MDLIEQEIIKYKKDLKQKSFYNRTDPSIEMCNRLLEIIKLLHMEFKKEKNETI